MDSRLSIQVKHEPISDAHDKASSQNLTTHEQGYTQGDLRDSVVRDNDSRILISSPSIESPFNLASSENRFTQNTPLGSDQRHTDSPLFDKPEVFYEVTGGDRHIAQPRLHAKLGKGFFKTNGKWTAYRRNYFSVHFAVSCPQDIKEGMYIQRGGAELQRIHGFSVKLLASVHGKDEIRELVQHTPKRDPSTGRVPEEVLWFPLSANTTGGEAASRSEETNIPRNFEFPKNDAGESILFSHTFEKIQFAKATANNGKGREKQQYFNIVIELNAQISSGENDRDLHWLRIARRTSEPFIIRGRSPGHYKDQRTDSHIPIINGGDDTRLGSFMALRMFPIADEWHTDSRTNAERTDDPGTNLEDVNPVLNPDLYFGTLEDMEWEIAQNCPLVLHAMSLSLASWRDTVAILTQILNHAKKGLELLKVVRFAGTGYNILIEQSDDRDFVKAVSFGSEVLDNFISILAPSTGLLSPDPEHLVEMSKAASATFAQMGLKVRPANTPTEIMLQFAALVCMLGLGLVSYSGSHTSAFHEKYLDSTTKFIFHLSEGLDDNLSISLRQVRLSCLHAYIGGPVWAFCLGDFEMTCEKTLLSSLETVADLWGPLRISYTSEGLILAIGVERGTIVGLRPEADREGTVSCHWFQWGEKLPESPFAFEDTALLAIGSSSVTSEQTMEAGKCNYSPKYCSLGPKLRATSELTLLGVERSNWAADTLSANVGFSKFVNMSAGVSFKKIPGRSMKSMLLFQWQDDYPDPQTLQVRMALEISALTGNALRVPLWRLFQMETIRDYVGRVFPDQLSRPTDKMSFLDAFNDGFQQFLKSWSADADFRSSAKIIIRTVLANLQYTGPAEGGNLRAWYVENGGCLQIQRCDRHPWLGLLRDSAYESSLALINSRPIHFGFPTASGNHPIDDRWGTLLHTRIIPKPLLQQPRKFYLKGKSRPSEQWSGGQGPLNEPIPGDQTPSTFDLKRASKALKPFDYALMTDRSMCGDLTSHAANAVSTETLKSTTEQPILVTLRKVFDGYTTLELSENPFRNGKHNILQLKSSRLSGFLPLRYRDDNAKMFYKEVTGYDQHDSFEVCII